MYTPSPGLRQQGGIRSPQEQARTMLRMEQIGGAIERAREECFGPNAPVPQAAEVIHAYFKLREDTASVERLPESEVARLGRQMQVPPNHADVIRKVHALVRLELEASSAEADHFGGVLGRGGPGSGRPPRSARSAPSPAYTAPPPTSARRRQPQASPKRLSARSGQAPASADRARAAYAKGPKGPKSGGKRREPAERTAEKLMRSVDMSTQRRAEEAQARRERDESARLAKLEEAHARREQRDAERKLGVAAARRAKSEEQQALKEDAMAQFEQVEQELLRKDHSARSRSPAGPRRKGSPARGRPRQAATSPRPKDEPAAAARPSRDEEVWLSAKKTALEKRARREQQAAQEEEQKRAAAAVPVVSPAHLLGGAPRASSPHGGFMGPRSRSPGRKQPIDRVSVLFREGGKLGISFNGPVRGPAMVTAIASGSVAARMRNLKVGMVLCEVAGVSVEGVQFAESLNRLEQCARPLALCFRQPSDKEVRAHEEHELREEAAAAAPRNSLSPQMLDMIDNAVAESVSPGSSPLSQLLVSHVCV